MKIKGIKKSERDRRALTAKTGEQIRISFCVSFQKCHGRAIKIHVH